MDQHIKDVLKAYVRKNGMEPGVYTQRIKELWAERMSESVVAHTHRIQYNNGILTLWIDSAPLRHEMFGLREQIKKMVCEAFPELNLNVVLVK